MYWLILIQGILVGFLGDRMQLSKIIPGLRPWEVLSIEQAMDQITYGGEWYREPLGSHTTGPPYIREWNRDMLVCSCFFQLCFKLLIALAQ